jgi:Na+-transporting NADH:ubiquinone oxidoreductase subunit NqrB
MKFIHKLFDSSRVHFEKGGRFEKLYPLFEATESFFFIPGIPTRADSHVRDSLDVKRFMSFVILALMPPFLFGIYNTGYQSAAASGGNLNLLPVFTNGLIIVLPVVIVSYGVGFFWEILFAVIRKHPISEGFLVTGLLFPLTLPPTIPLWQAAVGISFGVVIGKEVFGGTSALLCFVGAGMAPLKSQILHQLSTLKTRRIISFWYGARSMQELFFDEIFKPLEKSIRIFHIMRHYPSRSRKTTGRE